MARKPADPMDLLADVDKRQMEAATTADDIQVRRRQLDARRREIEDARRQANTVSAHIEGTVSPLADAGDDLYRIAAEDADLRAQYDRARAAEAALTEERHRIIVDNLAAFEVRAEQFTEAANEARAEAFAGWREAERKHSEGIGAHMLVADALRAIHRVEYKPVLPNPLTEATTHVRTALTQPAARMWRAITDREAQVDQVKRDESEQSRMFEVLR